MPSLKAVVVDTFATTPLAGAPARVVQVPSAVSLGNDQQQQIATELGSPVAFVQDTPSEQVQAETVGARSDRLPLATLVAMADGSPAEGTHTIAVDDRQINLTVDANAMVHQSLDSDTITTEKLDAGTIAEALGLKRSIADSLELQPAVVTTTSKWLVTAVPYFTNLKATTPRWEHIAESCDVDGLYVIAFETLEAAATVHARAFIQGHGEQPAAPSGAAAAGVYLSRTGAIDTSTLTIEQGDLLNRPSRLQVTVDPEVTVGGHGHITLEGSLQVPDDDGEEIIEA